MPPQGGWQPDRPGEPPYGRPSFGPQGPPPPGFAPPPPGFPGGQWPPQQPPPPKGGGSLKWLLIAVAVLLVICIGVGLTLWVTRDNDGGRPSASPTEGAPSDVASAADTGPIAIITEDPTCEEYTEINNTLSRVEANGWSDVREQLGPAAEWTPAQRQIVQEVVTAMGSAAEQAAQLADQTPHRVVRELYEQFIAYAKAYTDALPAYAPVDNNLASANVSAGSALLGICQAVSGGSSRRSIVVGPGPKPAARVQTPSGEVPERFVQTFDETCREWVDREAGFVAAMKAWEQLDPSSPASQWTPEQRAVQDGAYALMETLADQMDAAAASSDNPVLSDFSVLAGRYLRAYVSAGDAYTGADSWLAYTALRLNSLVGSACDAAS